MGRFGGRAGAASAAGVMCRAVGAGYSGWRPCPQVSVRGRSSSRHTGPSGTAGTGSPVPAPTSTPVRPSVTATWRPSCTASRPQVRPAWPPLQGRWGASSRRGLECSPRLWSCLGGRGREAAWAHTPSPAPCFLRSLAGPRCPDADLSGGLDLVTWRLALPRAAPSQGLQLRPPGWRCCPVWPRGRTTRSQGELSRKTHWPQCTLVSEIQRVPSSSPVRALTLCEHFRDRSEDHPEAACRGQHRAPDWLHRQQLPGVQGSGRLLGSGLGVDEQRCDRGLPAARRDGQRRWSAVCLPPVLCGQVCALCALGAARGAEATGEEPGGRAWAGLPRSLAPRLPDCTWPAPSPLSGLPGCGGVRGSRVQGVHRPCGIGVLLPWLVTRPRCLGPRRALPSRCRSRNLKLPGSHQS